MEKTYELTLTRMLNAPREIVFKAWTEENQLAQWWGPHGFTNPVCEADAKPGGNILIHMKAPDGIVYPMTGTFKEVHAPERVVFISRAVANDRVLFEVLNTVTFEEENGKTKLTVHAKPYNITAEAEPYLAGMEAGWSQSLEKLELYIKLSFEH